MVQVKAGTVVPRETLKSGEKDGRKWLVGRVDALKGYDKITVWADNASEFGKDEDLQVVSISSVTKKNKKFTADDGTEKWVDQYEVNATLKPAVNEVQGAIPGFSQISDEDVPF
jgi:hypothetical protein